MYRTPLWRCLKYSARIQAPICAYTRARNSFQYMGDFILVCVPALHAFIFRKGRERSIINSLNPVIRSNILHFHYQNETTQQQRKYVSAISGGLSGGAITRLMGTYVPLYHFITYKLTLRKKQAQNLPQASLCSR